MKGIDYIQAKQRMWARSRKVQLQGSQGNKGELNYVVAQDENFYEKILPQHEKELNAGDGNEFKDGQIEIAKTKALHSSSVLCINLFHYWSRKNELDKLCHALNLCNQRNDIARTLTFEMKFPIFDTARRHPNLDVVIENPDDAYIKAYAIESKFTEPYSSRKEGKKSHRESLSKYLHAESIWKGLTHLKEHCESKNLDDEYKYLDMPQLVKHILGLKRFYGKSGFRILYLWYDVPGGEGWQHRKETEQFITHTKKDRLKVMAISYQELFARFEKLYINGNEEYMSYLSDRYF